ncbi:MAG: molybdopterin-dependent oxidoreductase, partial [Acidobacteriota bacterium]
MSGPTPITRRELLAGLAAAGGMMLAGCSPTDPPTYGNLLRAGDLLTYKAHRLLLPRQALAREYERHDITSIPAVGTSDPADPAQPYYNAALGAEYDRLRAGSWADWRLRVEGLVARPMSLSLADLQRLGARTQITRHTCEEGWSAIAEWTGVPLSRVLDACGMRPQARFVNFESYDETVDSIDMVDALHPQTILA